MPRRDRLIRPLSGGSPRRFTHPRWGWRFTPPVHAREGGSDQGATHIESCVGVPQPTRLSSAAGQVGCLARDVSFGAAGVSERSGGGLGGGGAGVRAAADEREEPRREQ